MRLYILIIFLVFTTSVFSQTSPQHDRWNELVIDESTVADALRILGAPISDKIGSLKVMMVKSWLSKEAKGKNYRHLEYRKVGDFSKVNLAFLDDKLVFIEFEPSKKVLVDEAPVMRGLAVRQIFENDDVSGKPGEFPKVRKSRTVYIEIRKIYHIGAAEKTFIVCLVEGVNRTDPIMFQPERYIDILQMISRKLEVK